MLKKIISGGQRGADQAALDAALKFNFPHGGWIQKGRRIKGGVLPEKYQLKEMPIPGFKDRIERNVMDSDGTAIFSHGMLTGGADYSLKMVRKHQRPGLHVDLKKTPATLASSKLNAWAMENLIEVMKLLVSCRAVSDEDVYGEDEVRAVIIRSIWNKLRQGGMLRVVQ